MTNTIWLWKVVTSFQYSHWFNNFFVNNFRHNNKGGSPLQEVWCSIRESKTCCLTSPQELHWQRRSLQCPIRQQTGPESFSSVPHQLLVTAIHERSIVRSWLTLHYHDWSIQRNYCLKQETLVARYRTDYDRIQLWDCYMDSKFHNL